MKKIITLICILIFSGFFFQARVVEGAQDFVCFYDSVDSVGQGAVNANLTPNRFTISGEEAGQTKVVTVDIVSSSSLEKDYMEFCKRAALLALSNSTKYQLDIVARGDVVDNSVVVDLSDATHYLFCNLSSK